MCGLYACTIVSNIYPKNDELIGEKYFGGASQDPREVFQIIEIEKLSGKLQKLKKRVGANCLNSVFYVCFRLVFSVCMFVSNKNQFKICFNKTSHGLFQVSRKRRLFLNKKGGLTRYDYDYNLSQIIIKKCQRINNNFFLSKVENIFIFLLFIF